MPKMSIYAQIGAVFTQDGQLSIGETFKANP